MRFTTSAWALLTMLLVTGCSSSETDEVAETSEAVSTALASTMPLITEFEKSTASGDESNDPLSPFDDNLELFSAPKMIIPIEDPLPDELDDGVLPPLRLVGFVGSSGEKAMVAVDGKMHLVTAGKRLAGVEIVKVASPDVELRWGETELTLNFYKPSKGAQASAAAPRASSPGLMSLGNDHPSSNQRKPPRPPTPAPHPQVALPSLPALPTPGASTTGNATGGDLPDFPDLGGGPGPPPTP